MASRAARLPDVMCAATTEAYEALSTMVHAGTAGRLDADCRHVFSGCYYQHRGRWLGAGCALLPVWHASVHRAAAQMHAHGAAFYAAYGAFHGCFKLAQRTVLLFLSRRSGL